MCRHCERLVEDIQHKELIHEFMEVLTVGVNRKLAEDGMGTRVTPDEVEFYVTVPNKEPLYKGASMGMEASVLRLLYRDLLDAVK